MPICSTDDLGVRFEQTEIDKNVPEKCKSCGVKKEERLNFLQKCTKTQEIVRILKHVNDRFPFLYRENMT